MLKKSEILLIELRIISFRNCVRFNLGTRTMKKRKFLKLVFLIHKTDDSYPIQLNLHVTFSRIIRVL